MKLVPLRLLTQFSQYNTGEVAGFTADRAKKMVAAGYAEYVDLKTDLAKAAKAKK